jgi:hypothetical protein
MFSARVQQRRVFVVGVLGVWVAFAISVFVSDDLGVLALTYTLAAAGVLVAIGLFLFAPTRIEIAPDAIRLVARRTTTTYVPDEMIVLRLGPGRFALVRPATNRTLAVFRSGDEAEARAALEAAGARVVS